MRHALCGLFTGTLPASEITEPTMAKDLGHEY